MGEKNRACFNDLGKKTTEHLYRHSLFLCPSSVRRPPHTLSLLLHTALLRASSLITRMPPPHASTLRKRVARLWLALMMSTTTRLSHHFLNHFPLDPTLTQGIVPRAGLEEQLTHVSAAAASAPTLSLGLTITTSIMSTTTARGTGGIPPEAMYATLNANYVHRGHMIPPFRCSRSPMTKPHIFDGDFGTASAYVGSRPPTVEHPPSPLLRAWPKSPPRTVPKTMAH